MTIGFFYVQRETTASEQNYDCARALIASAKRCMPSVPIVQFTDETTKKVKGVDQVRRKHAEPMACLRMRHHASVPGNWVFVDTDVIFQHRVIPVFQSEDDWQIALTSRDWTHVKAAAGFSERMPYNTGVVFSRYPRFWAEVYSRLRWKDPEEQEWMGDQAVIGEIVTEEPCRYRVKVLSGRKFNYPPTPRGVSLDAQADQDESDAWIVHYKGPERKALMLDRYAKVRRCA